MSEVIFVLLSPWKISLEMTNTLSQPSLETAHMTVHFRLGVIIDRKETESCLSFLWGKYLFRNEQCWLNILCKVRIFDHLELLSQHLIICFSISLQKPLRLFQSSVFPLSVRSLKNGFMLRLWRSGSILQCEETSTNVSPQSSKAAV